MRDHETGLSGWKCSFFLLPIYISRSTLTYRALYHGKIETQTSYIYIYIYIYIFFLFLPLWAIVGLQLTSCWTLSYSWLTKAKVACSRLQENGLRKFWAKTAWGLGRDGEGGACIKHHCCQCLIPVTSSWYTPWLVNFDSLRQHLRQSLGFARRVKQTWRACETLLHCTFPHFNISFFFFSFLVFWREKRFSGSGRGRKRTQVASSPVVLGDFGCGVTCQACRSRSVPSLLW